MTTSTQTATLEIVRTLPASPERVFGAWTKPEKMRVWFAPGPLNVALAQADLRVGGHFRIEMKGPDGTFVAIGTYQDFKVNERLVMTWGWEGSPEPESLLTVTLRAVGDQTELKLVHERLANEESRARHLEGWEGCLAKLAESIGVKAVNCADLGCCDDIVTAPDDAQLMQALFAHAASAHPDMAKAMTPEQSEQIKARIPQVIYSI